MSATLHIVPGPTDELSRKPDGVRWCFGCRERLPHDLVILGDSEPSYYEPVAVRECSGCGKDRTDFPC
jgi:hypothetical protein